MIEHSAIRALVTLSLIGIVVAASAQSSGIRGSSFSDLQVCMVGNHAATRIRNSESGSNFCDQVTRTTVRSEREVDISLDPLEQPSECHASVTTDYVQSDALVLARTMIDMEGCTTANGEHQVVARVEDNNGDVATLEFNETWRVNSNDSTEILEAEYPLGANVRLLSLRAKGLRCGCSDHAD